MPDSASIPRRIARIKRLMREYFPLPPKAPIEKYTEKLNVFDIRGSIHAKHPHKGYRVYISRRSIKHFVEERKAELSRKHSPEETLSSMDFALDNLQEVITNFDEYAYVPPRHFYTKDYSSRGKPLMRVVLDDNGKALEVCSIHFKTKRGKTEN